MNRPNNRILKPDTKIQEALEALRDYLDNINKAPDISLGSVYKAKEPTVVQTVKVDGLVFGYKIEDHHVFIRRIVFIKVPGFKVSDFSDTDRERILTAVFNVFVLPGGRTPEIVQVASDCLRMIQDTVPMILTERKPGLITLSGGWKGEGNASGI